MIGMLLRYLDILRMSIRPAVIRERKYSWCRKENNLHAPDELREKVRPAYSDETVKTILQFIKDTDIINDVGGDVEQLSLIAKYIYVGMKGIRNGVNS